MQRAARAVVRRYDDFLRPLEQRGLAKMKVGEVDRRSHVLTLMPAGQALLVAPFRCDGGARLQPSASSQNPISITCLPILRAVLTG